MSSFSLLNRNDEPFRRCIVYEITSDDKPTANYRGTFP